MKKIFAVLCVLVVLTAAGMAQPSLTDLQGHWAEDVVREAVARGIVHGYPDGTFKPDETIKRGEFVKLVTLALGLEVPEEEGHWSAPYVAAAVYAEVVTVEAEFDPEGLLPREEMAAMVVRGLGFDKGGTLGFDDADEVSLQYRDYVAVAAAAELILGYPGNVFKPQDGLTRAEAAVVISRLLKWVEAWPLQPGLTEVKMMLGGQLFRVNAVLLERESVYPRVVLAHDQVRGLESLESMAKRRGAVAAITGGFFDYRESSEPWGTIISNSWLVHRGDVGSTLGFLPDGTIMIDQLRMRIVGSSGKYPNLMEESTWSAWNLNRTPGASGINIYTRHRGSTIGFSFGISVVVENGQVTRIVENENVAIPSSGYVINFNGDSKKHAENFYVGQYLSFRGKFTDPQENQLEAWNRVADAVSAGPTLLKDGKILADPKSEGLTTTLARTMRTAFGVTEDDKYLLVTVNAGMADLARVMQKLGAQDAINMDGGGSAGMWFNGKYVTKPGRLLNNAIIFTAR